MFGFGIMMVVLIGAFALGKLTEGPATLDTIKNSTSDMAFGQLCGKEKNVAYQFKGAVTTFQMMYDDEQPETWQDIKDLAVGAIPPVESQAKDDVANVIGQNEGMGIDYVRDHHLDHEVQEVQDAIIASAIHGLLDGAEKAKRARGVGCLPSMLVR